VYLPLSAWCFGWPVLLFPVIVLPSVCGKGLRMEQDHQKEIERIIGQLKCPKDFVCYKSEFETLCQVKDIGLKDYLKCLEEDASFCPFSACFGSINFCHCPLRVYIFRKLGK
jgi:hypothetical protein